MKINKNKQQKLYNLLDSAIDSHSYTAGKMKNPNCDNNKCLSKTGEIRVLPTGGSSNAILCQACFAYEIQYRRERNQSLETRNRFKIPQWNNLEIYDAK